jgi:hypothetical protein
MNREFIDACVEKANKHDSKCTQNILKLNGMSGSMTRHLYNNLLSLKKDDNTPIKYLEIGCWKGSSTLSALHDNNVLCTVIDNWSEFSGPKNEFHRNIAPYNNVQILEQDSFHPDILHQLQHAPYDIYLYDGGHKIEDHEKAITHLWDALANTCIILVDDWCWEKVQQGTYRGFEKVNANIVYKLEVTNPKGSNGFWNGCGIFLVQK